jgi:putative tryptophan/tyrosine transport system substrate-binding protein
LRHFGAFKAARSQESDPFVTVEDPLTLDHRKLVADFATARLHGSKEFVVAGGLISYGANLADVICRAAIYVDQILRGSKPADLPIQQPTKIEVFRPQRHLELKSRQHVRPRR